MRFGYFDNDAREYVIDRVDVPTSWTNYLGVQRACAVLSQVAGGYQFYERAESTRVTRFRPNGVPMDWPGHWVYLRDDEDGDYWSVSWQPVGKPLAATLADGDDERAGYECRHGLSYSRFRANYRGIDAEQTVFITRRDDTELWDVRLTNTTDRTRHISAFGYVEFSFHDISSDNQNLQMSLYSAGTRVRDGIIEYELKYARRNKFHFMATDGEPDSHDAVREEWIGPYRTERNPLAVERGAGSGSEELTGNHCGGLHRRVTLEPGQTVRLTFMLGTGDAETGRRIRDHYRDPRAVDAAFDDLRTYWDDKCSVFRATTPHAGLDTMVNIWTLYQAETCVTWSRFASFIEVGGRTGLGYRDTSQDIMAVVHTNPDRVRQRMRELLHGQVSAGYGLHLFDPSWFTDGPPKVTRSVTSAFASGGDYIHSAEDACSDDHLWLVPSILEYVKESGDVAFLDEVVPFADGGEATVWEHMRRALDFSAAHVGDSGICLGLHADWNDCLNLGGGESTFVSFLHHWALVEFADAAAQLGRTADADRYRAIAGQVRTATEREAWNGQWFTRGTTAAGRAIGTPECREGKVFLESNTWAVISGAASPDRGRAAMDAVEAHLASPWGLHLLQPSFTAPDDEVGFMGRVYQGVKENGAIFSHPNPWGVIAECRLGRGDRAMRYYDALLPYNQNDAIEVRQAEPYSYCQFVFGREHRLHGRARHPWLTGSAGWSYTAATHWILGVRPGFDGLTVDPCIPAEWDGFRVDRRWRGASYAIRVENPSHVSQGVVSVVLDGVEVPGGVLPVPTPGAVHEVLVTMG